MVSPRPGNGLCKALLVIPLILLLGVVLHKTRAPGHLSVELGHPIDKIIERSRLRFAEKLSRQSATLPQAVAEYQRRYRRSPPAGFDRWFEIAQQNDFVLVDEFDTFMQSLEPFRGIHPSILQQRLSKLLENHDFAHKLTIFEFKNHQVTYHSEWNATGEALLNPQWFESIPYNMTIALNFFDEPMVSASFDTVADSLSAAQRDQQIQHVIGAGQTDDPQFLNLGRRNAWATTKSACSLNSPARAETCQDRQVDMPLEFLENMANSMDICERCEIHEQYGLLLTPETLQISTDLIPVWSMSQPSLFNDILYPSAYYIQSRHEYESAADKTWHKKDNKIYWVGTATGGYTTEQNWFQFQRQRLVMLTAPTSYETIQLLEETGPDSGEWQPRLTTMRELSGMFATRLTRIVQANPRAQYIQERVFGIERGGHRDEQKAAYAHKFLMDIDGNGFSGRFYRLLQSRSVVMKSTIQKEWHDDRLIPWVHYVPLSLGYSELPEIARFLATTRRGEELSERIARESTEWHNKALRDVDLQIAFLRMLLEYGRLMDNS